MGEGRKPIGLRDLLKELQGVSMGNSPESHRGSRPFSPVCAPRQDKGKSPVTSRPNKNASRQSMS